MKIKSLIINTLLILMASTQTSIAEERGPALKAAYSADKITQDVYVIHGPIEEPNVENQGFMNNPAIIITSAGLVIIDPGSTVQTGEMVLSHAKKISDLPVVATFSTHVHGDHWLGNQAIKEAYPKAKLYGHPMLIELAEAGEAEKWLAIMRSSTDGGSKGTVATIPDTVVNDGDEIKIGDKTFKITHKGQAHSKTDIMIHVVESDIYFLGDNNPNGRMGRMDDGSFVGLIKTLDSAIEADAKHYVPGHGPTGSKEIVLNYQKFLSTIYDTSGEYYEEGLSDFEMKPLMMEKLQPWHEWQGFHEAIGKFISLAVLEYESHAFD